MTSDRNAGNGRALFAGLLVVSWLVPMISAASASHPAATYYDAIWTTSGDNDQTPQWRIATNVPTGNHRERIRDAAADWNRLQANPTLDYIGTTSELNFSTPCSQLEYQENSVEWGEFAANPEPLAERQGCTDFADNRLRSFQIKFNDDTNWYTGAEGSGITNTTLFDLQGLAAHEFGHAHGRIDADNDGHFSESDNAVCPESYGTRHTMCPRLDSGVAGWRNFEAHDRETHLDAYY